jgi:hypothetical protein
MVIGAVTAIHTGEPRNQNPVVSIAAMFTTVFVTLSALNTIFMIFDTKKTTSSAHYAIVFFALTIAVAVIFLGLNLDPGSSPLLYKTGIVDYIVVCLVAGAIIDVADLFIVNHKDS